MVLRQKFVFFLTLAYMFVIPLVAQAQTPGLNPDRKEPLEITADKSLEWHRTQKFFKALENVKAKQGDVSLFADILTAKYREGKESSMEIYHIQADGSVVIDSAKSKAYGDKAVYEIDKGLAVMTGKNLRLVSTDQTVTARDRFEYWAAQGQLKAIGKAVAIRQGDKLEADKIEATFKEDAKGQRVLEKMEAHGNVKITTPTEVLRGNYGVYTAKTNVAEVKGNVRITRGPNILEGERAQVDLNTNISKMFGSIKSTGSGRVRGVFYPSSEKKTK